MSTAEADPTTPTERNEPPSTGTRAVRCILTYICLHMAAWVAVAFTAPSDDPFGQTMGIALGMMAFTGIPSVALAIGAAAAHTRMDLVRFRWLIAFPMALFALPAASASAVAEPLVFQVLAHGAFACLMPTPLTPGNWKGTPLD
ncbi:hypothetical protein OG594_22495 [Streptomyces sp. NBC_01214]|uniref:hypothetical protein n=1 Tax=Streptomyces sp. NBC_01214 TaxID=2903777 RepID=UPI00224EA8E1|nr:hypothetical protein [Streptomyces sp. NBC_01214]MCX4804378.1 hypothetical protein [Streptomyces sp. NBC_01214]